MVNLTPPQWGALQELEALMAEYQAMRDGHAADREALEARIADEDSEIRVLISNKIKTLTTFVGIPFRQIIPVLGETTYYSARKWLIGGNDDSAQ